MDFEKISKIVFKELKFKLEKHNGLSVFAKRKAKFEGWLKVELCDSLLKYFKDIVPENNRIDICFLDWAIELKTINTNMSWAGVGSRRAPISKNIRGVLKDINKLKKISVKNKAVLFIAFPAKENGTNWLNHYKEIKKELPKVESRAFNFQGGVPGVIYFGQVTGK